MIEENVEIEIEDIQELTCQFEQAIEELRHRAETLAKEFPDTFGDAIHQLREAEQTLSYADDLLKKAKDTLREK